MPLTVILCCRWIRSPRECRERRQTPAHAGRAGRRHHQDAQGQQRMQSREQSGADRAQLREGVGLIELLAVGVVAVLMWAGWLCSFGVVLENLGAIAFVRRLLVPCRQRGDSQLLRQRRHEPRHGVAQGGRGGVEKTERHVEIPMRPADACRLDGHGRRPLHSPRTMGHAVQADLPHHDSGEAKRPACATWPHARAVFLAA